MFGSRGCKVAGLFFKGDGAGLEATPDNSPDGSKVEG